MPCLADLNGYRPERDPEPGSLIRYLQKAGWAEHSARDLLSAIQGPAMPAAHFAFMRELDRTRFGTPERHADLEMRLMKEADSIQHPETRRHYRQFFKEQLRHFFGFDYRQRQASNVVAFKPKQSNAARLNESLDRLMKAKAGIEGQREEGCSDV